MSAARRVKKALRRSLGAAGSVVSVRTGEQLVALTYDDGPEPGGTDRILEALDDAGATATFFVLLTRARRHPRLLEQIVAGGHEVALHGIDHRPLTSFSAAQVLRRCVDGKDELEQRSGQAVRWMRPPYGKQLPWTALAIRRSGLTAVLWGPSTEDTVEGTVDERAARATATARRGDVLLAHDGYASIDDGVDDGPAPVFDRGLTTARILSGYAELGLRARSLGTVLAHGSARREAVFRR